MLHRIGSVRDCKEARGSLPRDLNRTHPHQHHALDGALYLEWVSDVASRKNTLKPYCTSPASLISEHQCVSS
eukprot:3472362-Rhodomonas_salina.2